MKRKLTLHKIIKRKLRSDETTRRPLWPWSYGSWIYNYQCNQCLSPLISIRARCTQLCDKVCQIGDFSLGPPVSSTNKHDSHDITELLFKVALNTIKQTNEKTMFLYCTSLWSNIIMLISSLWVYMYVGLSHF